MITHCTVVFVLWSAVSNESREFLRKSHEWPLIDVSQLNPNLYEQVERLKTSRVCRSRLLLVIVLTTDSIVFAIRSTLFQLNKQ